MAIKRNITDISALKRGANNVTAVYRGNTLIWPTTPPVAKSWTIDTWVMEGNGFYKDITPITTWTIDQGIGFTQKLY